MSTIDQHIILINGRYLSQHMTGVHRFAYEMTKSLYANGVNIMVLAPEYCCDDYTITFPVTHIGGKGTHWWEQICLPAYIRKHYNSCTLINFTGIGPVTYKHNIITIHDMSFWVQPKWFSKSYYLFYRVMTPWAARKAQCILTVSDFSKREIQRLLHLPQEKIHVVYNGIDNNIKGEHISGMKPYILGVSSIDPRKNIQTLVDAYLLTTAPDIRLIIVGKNNNVFGKQMIDTHNNNNIQLIEHLDDKGLAGLYANALLFVSTSLYEGFGLTNLEAMSNGCPIVVSDIPTYREICGEAAVYCAPTDSVAFAKEIDRIIQDPKLQEQMRERSCEQAKRFSWERSAKQLSTLLK